MTKKDLAEMLMKQTGITGVEAKQTVKAIFGFLAGAMIKGETLEFRDFGVFKTRVRKARTARNPRAGTVVQVPERKAIVWKMGKELRERIRVTTCNA